MQEKVMAFKKESAFVNWGDIIRNKLLWAVLAAAAEAGAAGTAPGAAALAAGLSGEHSLFAFIGGVIGAVIRGLPESLGGLAALAIVLAARLIPDMKRPVIRAAERTAAAGAAVFLSGIASVTSASDLLNVILSALVSAAFALCVCRESDKSGAHGIDVNDPRSCARIGIIIAMWFMAAGGLDFPILNVGRLLFAAILLLISSDTGLARSAVFGISALVGLYPAAGGGAAVMAFAALASRAFSKHGKFIRAAAFLFFTAFTALAAGIDEGSWRILTEGAAAAVLYAFIPFEKTETADSDISDGTVALMLRERLNFAAEAIAGVGSGIAAAAETLDRKYSLNFDDVAESAADRVCRTCPNSMTCWGRKYELFRTEFTRLTEQLRSGAELTEFSMSPECSEECVNRTGVIRAVTAEYSRYVSAAADERRVNELRRIYTDQLESVKDILKNMGSLKSGVTTAPRCKNAKRRAEKLLSESGASSPQAFVTLDARGKLHIEAYSKTEPRVERGYLGMLLSKAVGREMELPEIAKSGTRCRVTASERTALSARIGAYQIPRGKNRACGDCYDAFTDPSGALWVILSDGMGTGARARVDSTMSCGVLAKLLKAGITLPSALEMVNTALMVKSSDESFSTLDIFRLDLNTGECVVYKAGAATTYIKSADKLIRAGLSSPPAGLGGRLTVPAQKFTVRPGDTVVMMTDGVNPDEQWLSRELSKPSDPAGLSECIAKAARSSENPRDDDISVIAIQVER